MKKTAIFCGLILFTGIGCQKNNQGLVDQLSKLEKRLEILEKKLEDSAAAARPQAPAPQEAAYDLPVGDSYVKGNKNAPLTLVKFSDYQCPFCARAQDGFVDKIFADPELKDKVKVVFKHFPLSFHKNARGASQAALAAGEQGHDCFWKMSEKLYASQRDLNDEVYPKWAGEITCEKSDGKVGKLDAKKFAHDLKNNAAKYEKMIADDMKLGMETAGVRGTPTFLLNGWKLGQRDVDAIKQMAKEKHLLN